MGIVGAEPLAGQPRLRPRETSAGRPAPDLRRRGDERPDEDCAPMIPGYGTHRRRRRSPRRQRQAHPASPVFFYSGEIFAFAPVYMGGNVPSTLEERRVKLVGWVASHLRRPGDHPRRAGGRLRDARRGASRRRREPGRVGHQRQEIDWDAFIAHRPGQRRRHLVGARHRQHAKAVGKGGYAVVVG